MQSSVGLLGHIVDKYGVHADEEKIPKSKKRLRPRRGKSCVLSVVGKFCCFSVELVSPKPESGFQLDNLIVGSNRPVNFRVMGRFRLDR